VEVIFGTRDSARELAGAAEKVAAEAIDVVEDSTADSGPPPMLPAHLRHHPSAYE
jgi:hypothetical protein